MRLTYDYLAALHAEWQRAMDHKRAIDALNEPTRAQNRRDKLRGRSNRRLPHRYEPWARVILDGEARYRAALHRVGPEEWRRRVDLMPEPVRTRCARLIWWDWFAGRLVCERWPHLDDLVDAPMRDAPMEEMAIALYLAGYSPAAAVDRCLERWRYWGDKVPAPPVEEKPELIEG